MFDLFNIKSKVIFIALLPLAMLSGVAVITVLNLDKMKETSAWVTHTANVLAEADAIVAAAVDMETGVRGYLLAGRDQFLEPYQQGEAQVYDILTRLQNTISDNPPQVARLQEAEQILRDWQTEVVTHSIEFRREIGHSATMNDMADSVAKAEGKAYFDKFREQIQTFIDIELTLLDNRKRTMNAKLASGSSTVQETEDSIRWVEHTYRVVAKANAILASAVDMETGMRGFLLSGDEAFLEPYDAGSAGFFAGVEDLSATVSDNPEQVARLSDIKSTIEDWIVNAVDPKIALRRKIGDSPTMDDMADLIAEARGKTYFDAFRAVMADFAAEEKALQISRTAENQETAQNTRFVVMAASMFAVLIGVICALLTGTNISRGLGAITRSMDRIAGGEKNAEVEGAKRKDEVGIMARSLISFRDILVKEQEQEIERSSQEAAKLSEVMTCMSTHLSMLAEGDVSTCIDEAFPPEFENLRSDFNIAVANLGNTLKEVQSTVRDLLTGADQLNTSTSELSQRTENQAATLEQSAAALEQLLRSVESSARNSNDTATISSTARNDAENSRAVVESAIATMSGIKQSSDTIGTITGAIDDIAFQTNLLALNAGIEAARAGESGKGFAVVAAEVQLLAQRSAQSATEIRDLVIQSAERIGEGVENVGMTEAALVEVVQHVTQIADLAAEVNSSLEQQTQALNEISSGVTVLDRVTQQNAAMVQETTTVATALNTNANRLDTLISGFRFKSETTGERVEDNGMIA